MQEKSDRKKRLTTVGSPEISVKFFKLSQLIDLFKNVVKIFSDDKILIAYLKKNPLPFRESPEHPYILVFDQNKVDTTNLKHLFVELNEQELRRKLLNSSGDYFVDANAFAQLLKSIPMEMVKRDKQFFPMFIDLVNEFAKTTTFDLEFDEEAARYTVGRNYKDFEFDNEKAKIFAEKLCDMAHNNLIFIILTELIEFVSYVDKKGKKLIKVRTTELGPLGISWQALNAIAPAIVRFRLDFSEDEYPEYYKNLYYEQIIPTSHGASGRNVAKISAVRMLNDYVQGMFKYIVEHFKEIQRVCAIKKAELLFEKKKGKISRFPQPIERRRRSLHDSPDALFKRDTERKKSHGDVIVRKKSGGNLISITQNGGNDNDNYYKKKYLKYKAKYFKLKRKI